MNRPPTVGEICNYLDIEESKYSSFCFHAEISPLISIDEGEHPIRNQISTGEQNPQEELITKEQYKKLHQIVCTLSEQEQEIIKQYYFEGRKMKEIALNFNVSESRICQIHRKVKATLAKRMAN